METSDYKIILGDEDEDDILGLILSMASLAIFIFVIS
jgi:hypothetical protein